MAEYMTIVWLSSRTSKTDLLTIQRLQYPGVTLTQYMNEPATASFIASQVGQFVVCPTESGANLLLARLSSNSMESVANTVMNSCVGEAAIQVSEILRNGEKKELAWVGYRDKSGKVTTKETTVPAKALLIAEPISHLTSADPEALNCNGAMASVIASVASAILFDVLLSKDKTAAEALIEKATDLIKDSAPKVATAVESSIPMAKGAGEAVSKAVIELLKYVDTFDIKQLAARLASVLGKTAAPAAVGVATKGVTSAMGTTATAATGAVAGVGGVGAVGTAVSMAGSTAGAVATNTLALTAGTATGAAATTAAAGTVIGTTAEGVILAGPAVAAAAPVSFIPFVGWSLAGIALLTISGICLYNVISNAIPIPKTIEKDIIGVGNTLKNYSTSQYPSNVYQLAYASGQDWRKQLDESVKGEAAFIDSTIEGGTNEAACLIIRTKGHEAWDDIFPGWMMMNSQSMILELSSGEKLPLGIVRSNKEFADFIKLRIPTLSNPLYSKLIEKFAKQF